MAGMPGCFSWIKSLAEDSSVPPNQMTLSKLSKYPTWQGRQDTSLKTLGNQTTKTKRPADIATSTGLDFIVEI